MIVDVEVKYQVAVKHGAKTKYRRGTISTPAGLSADEVAKVVADEVRRAVAGILR